jgi:DNA-binding transcriptional ArsR family regulator
MDGKIKLLKAMGDETRIKILQYLLNGEKCACTIVPFIGKAQPTVSQHLKILVEAGILDVQRTGSRCFTGSRTTTPSVSWRFWIYREWKSTMRC